MSKFDVKIIFNEGYVDEKIENLIKRIGEIGRIVHCDCNGNVFLFTVESDSDESIIRTIINETISDYDDCNIK